MKIMEPSRHQKKILDWVKNGEGHLVCNAFAGSGKCLGKNTPIIMFDGTIKLVQDIVVGDTLMGDDSTARTVLATTFGTDNLFKIIPVKGDSWVCNSSHVLTLVNSVTNKISDVSLDNFLTESSSKYHDAKLFRVPADFNSNESISLDPYLAGLWLGDGTFTAPVITNASDKIRDYCINIASNYKCELVVREEPKKNTRNLRFRINKEGSYQYHTISRILKSEFCIDNEKRIPRSYLLSSREIRLQLLAGLLDTDGYNAKDSGYFELVTKHTGLKDDVLFLCRSLGFATYATVKSATIKKLNFRADYWRISIGGHINEIPCLLHSPAPRKQKKNVLRTGFKVEPVGLGEYFGFELDGNGRFLLGDFTVTHNSSSLKMIVLELEELGYTPNDIRICVFGKANSLDLVEKFGEKWKQSISTLHSIGWSILKQHLSIKKPSDYKIDTKKYDKIAEGLGLEFEDISDKNYLGKKTDFLKIVDLIRLTNKDFTPNNISDICQHFEISEIQDFDKISIAVEKCLKLGKKSALSTNKIIDFTDQIWLPVTWQLWKQDWFTTYSVVGIDESQDLNATQLELAIALVGDKGRLIFVGDRNQSIFGFSGADCNSIETIIKRTNATELPLSTCYRCPKSHIKLVRDIFPSILIEAFSKNKEGSISSISDKQLEDKDFLVTGDLLLGRRTSPLVKLCIQLISKGVSATVKGRSIGELLKSELREVVKIKPFEYKDFKNATDRYRSKKLEKWKDKENLDQLLENFEDRLAALIAIYESQINASSIKDLEDYIDTLFSDFISPVTLSTVHRAKGLEAERVFIIEPESLPLSWKNQNEWQLKQECNLLYVALTRSKSDLFIVGQPRWMKKKEEGREIIINVSQ